MPSDWPVNGKVSKAGKNNYVSPEKKYIDSYYENKDERQSTPTNEIKRKSSIDSDKQNQFNNNNSNNNEHNQNKNTKKNKEKPSKDSNSVEKQMPNESKNTYHCFRYSCGYKTNRKCSCLNKFVRMPLWYIFKNAILLFALNFKS